IGSSGWPGTIQSGARKRLAETVSSTTSSFATPRRNAVTGDIAATLSQVTVVTGFGSSCSQPLLAKRPSWIVESGRNVISRPDVGGAGASTPTEEKLRNGNAVP